MQLEMKERCGKCGDRLFPHKEAYICSYECTFCPRCAASSESICPHCGGELVQRQRRITSTTEAARSAPAFIEDRGWMIWAVRFGVWTFVAFAATVSIFQLYRSTGHPTSFFEVLSMEVSQILPYAPLTPLVFGLASRYPFSRDTWVRPLMVHATGGLAFAALHICMRALTPYAVWDAKTRAWNSAIWDPQTA